MTTSQSSLVSSIACAVVALESPLRLDMVIGRHRYDDGTRILLADIESGDRKSGCRVARLGLEKDS